MIGSDLLGKHAFYGLSGGDNHHVKHVFFFQAAMRQIKNTVLRWAAADIPDSQGFLALFSRSSDASEEALAQTA
ncbi:hypothetical protein ACO2JO_14930 [Leptospira interrogans]